MAVDDTGDDGVSMMPAEPESHVIDDANYSHKRRLTAIHNTRDRVIEVRNAVEEALITGSMSEFRARRYYRGAVESLIMETRPILESDQITLSKDYLGEVELGEVVVDPPQWLVNHARENITRLAPGQSVPQPQRITVTGLKKILNAPSPIARSFRVVTRAGKNGVDVKRGTSQTELSRDLLDQAVQQTVKALEEAEMGINIGEERPHNSLSVSGKKPWEELLPHEVVDAYEEGALTKEDVEQLREQHRAEQAEGDSE